MKGRIILIVLAFAVVINLPIVYGQLRGLDDRDDRLSTRYNVGLPGDEDGDEDEVSAENRNSPDSSDECDLRTIAHR